MNKEYLCINDKIIYETKGSTPKYVAESTRIVLNQKCIRNGMIDYSFAQYISEQQNIADEKYIKVGDVLLNSTGQGTAGRCAFVDHLPKNYKVTVDSHMLILRFKNIELARFFAYSLYNQENYILELLTGSSGQGELDREIVYNISFPYSNSNLAIFNQILVSINKKIQLNNKINIELEKIAEDLYNYWFVQFDFPDKNGRPYKSSGGKMIYNEKLKREIPNNWQEGKLFDYIENEKGGDWGKDEPQGNYSLKVKCIRGADIPTLNTCCISDVPIRYINKSNTFKILNNNDIIIEISGGSPIQSTGRIAYINSELLSKYDSKLITSNFCKAVSLKSSKYVYNFYLEWQILYNQGIFFNYEGKTTGIKNLLYDDFINSYNTVIPDKDTIEQFYKIVEPIFSQIQRNCKDAISLIKLRDFILPMLMNGQVSVVDSQKNNLSEEKIIKKSLEFWQSHGKMDIDQFARENGILVYKDNEQKKGAVSYNAEKDLYEIAVKDPRDNFTIAHEIGHILRHKNELKSGTLGRKSEESGTKIMEHEADSLAAEILMPEKYVLQYMQDKNKTEKDYLDEKFIKECAKYFNVNPPTMNIRLKNLGFKIPYIR